MADLFIHFTKLWGCYIVEIGLPSILELWFLTIDTCLHFTQDDAGIRWYRTFSSFFAILLYAHLVALYDRNYLISYKSAIEQDTLQMSQYMILSYTWLVVYTWIHFHHLITYAVHFFLIASFCPFYFVSYVSMLIASCHMLIHIVKGITKDDIHFRADICSTEFQMCLHMSGDWLTTAEIPTNPLK